MEIFHIQRLRLDGGYVFTRLATGALGIHTFLREGEHARRTPLGVLFARAVRTWNVDIISLLGIWQSLVRCSWRLRSTNWNFPVMTSGQCSIFFIWLGSTAGTCSCICVWRLSGWCRTFPMCRRTLYPEVDSSSSSLGQSVDLRRERACFSLCGRHLMAYLGRQRSL